MTDEPDLAVWRDAAGTVHSVAGDEALPGDVEAVLVDYLAVGADEAFERAEPLARLLASWFEDAIAEAAASDEVPDGPACDESSSDPPPSVDATVVRALERLRRAPSVADRLDLTEAASRLVDDWERYSIDVEKLVGHLLLEHGEAVPTGTSMVADRDVDLDHDELIARHAVLHRTR